MRSRTALTALAVVAVAGLTSPSAAPFPKNPQALLCLLPVQFGPCGMLGSDANGNPIFGGLGIIVAITEKEVNTNLERISLYCASNKVTNLSGKKQVYKGFLCGVVRCSDGCFFTTTDTLATVEANGRATLFCTLVLPKSASCYD